MAEAPRFSIRLAKEDFKFSAAHFTLFPDGRAELLHGHNYRVRVALAGRGLDADGLLVDVAAVKRRIRASCAALDERTLIPARTGRLEVRRSEGGVEVRFDGRSYRFPEGDVVLVPLENVSIELLARKLWQELAPELAGTPVEELTVEVEEAPGQSCAYRAPLPVPRSGRLPGRPAEALD
jgi:6-pyruvoyltetrahydropterin/6-carboxytetrahydropterin synthase